MTDTETFVLDCQDMFAYRDYQRECLKQNRKPQEFSEWYSAKYKKEIPVLVKNTINKSFKPKWKIAPKEKQKTLVPIDGLPVLLALPPGYN